MSTSTNIHGVSRPDATQLRPIPTPTALILSLSTTLTLSKTPTDIRHMIREEALPGPRVIKVSWRRDVYFEYTITAAFPLVLGFARV
jgi:hypothetical protein